MANSLNRNKKEKHMLITKIAELVSVGIPVSNALRGLSKSEGGDIGKQSAKILEQLNAGKNLKDAIGSVFTLNEVEMSILHSAGTSNLADSLNTISRYYKDLDDFKRDMMSTMVAPLVQFVLAVVVLSIIAFMVTPKISQSLPSGKSGVLTMMEGIRSFISILFVFLSIGSLFMIYIWLADRTLFSKFFSKIPILGSIKRYRDMYIFVKIVALMTKGGVGVVSAVKTSVLSAPLYLKTGIEEAMQDVMNRGTRLRDAFDKMKIFPFYVIDLVDTAEKTGQYGKFLEDAAELMRKDFKTRRSAVIPIVQFGSLLVVAFVVVIAFLSLGQMQNMGGMIK